MIAHPAGNTGDGVVACLNGVCGISEPCPKR